jgi:hypothetical protein
MNEASTLVVANPERSLTAADRIARGLGWFSIGLGLAEIVAPGKLARALGLEGKENLVRAFGAREIGAGVGALSTEPRPALWSRVGGDLLDLGTLAVGFRNGDSEQRRNAALAITAVLGVTLADLYTASALTGQRKQDRGETRDYSDRSGFPRGAPGRAESGGAADSATAPRTISEEAKLLETAK